MEYKFQDIEAHWKQYWKDNNTYKVTNDPGKEKCYVLDMFPYPSGAGLHVGHPLGYIASDIYSRYKRLKGFNVLHPMGFDAFGLPAEQYAIQTGQHPAHTTEVNIARYKEQLDAIGFDYDWSREVRTSDPKYYKFTQWVFIQLFHSWYNTELLKAQPIAELEAIFAKEGNASVKAASGKIEGFTAADWNGYTEKQQQEVLMDYRLAYLKYADVNWCPALGTVLANDEVKDGVSERGGHPVIKKSMRQWFLRITAYAQRLLDGLDTVDFAESLKEQQRNWVGRSEGASVFFKIDGRVESIEVFTTRPDTIFGATFLVLAPEHPLVAEITTNHAAVAEYQTYVQSRSERDRQADVKTVSGAFTGAYAHNPFTGKNVPIWIAEYVLMGYGTGAIMAVPSDDDRDNAFATKFGLPIIEVIDKSAYPGATRSDKLGKMINSGFLDGMEVPAAISLMCQKVDEQGIGKGKVNYRMRDAGFSRQRYWGEPFPVTYKDDMPYTLPESALPVILPEVDSYKPTPDGEPPLARNAYWVNTPSGPRETDTMPGYAGSSWYFLRYMDPHNDDFFVGSEAVNYWQDVDLYTGGAEHAVGHLLYSRFWHKFFFDKGWVPTQEPYKKLVNQGMIQGRSNFVYRIQGTNKFVSLGLKDQYETTALHVDVNIVDNDILDTEAFKNWLEEYADAEFILDNGKYECGWEVEKMSKSKYNVLNPDDIIAKYGADTFRMYEMFLGPIEQSKPWITNGLDGVHKFLRKYWRLFYSEGGLDINDEAPTKDELKVLHKTIKKIQDDIERLSFNTCISAFMIATNELTDLKCRKRAILKELTILLAPFAPHIAEELWQNALKESGTIVYAAFPKFDENVLVESNFNYPVSINGKVRATIDFPLDYNEDQVKPEVLANEQVQKWLEGKDPKKFIFVKGRIINVVV
jgi:leucyl-tRNA synthetase